MNVSARPHDPAVGESPNRSCPTLSWLRAWTAVILIFVLAVPLSQAADAWQSAQQQVADATPAPVTDSQNPPDAPTPTASQAVPAAEQQGNQPAAAASPTQDSTSQQQGTQPALGTAAAPVENPVGVAASKPAGAAIAPAKQRRRRTFAVRWAILIGAAVGVGTVVALSNASPNRPH